MEPFWCCLPDASKVPPGRAGGKLCEAPECPSGLSLLQGQSCSLPSPSAPVMQECLPSLCWLWCFSDLFVSWTSCRQNKGIPLNQGKLLARKGRRWECVCVWRKLLVRRATLSLAAASSLVWDCVKFLTEAVFFTAAVNLLERYILWALHFLCLLHPVTSSCEVGWVREGVWLKNIQTETFFLHG